ncbi:MAG: DUF6174 domain-containing protein [Chloroflexota bacterium]|nr:DUF6174 domain-containing protein [Chloroflexota bacterium]MDQ5865444.1 DUF6174 domain-containing protein [Chloroflexota bacterium]
MKPSAKHLLGTGLLVVAALPMLASYGTASLAAQPARQLHAVTAQATPTVRASVANFTRADYEAALAKWRAQDAAEYRIEVTLEAFSLLRGPWRLTVASDDAKEFVTKVERPEGLDPATAAVQELERLTVGGLFTQIEEALRSVENPSPDDTAYDYNVSFHPTLGYPVSFTAKPLDAFVADADYAYSVQSVTILQTGIYVPPAGGVVPGMPSTGHPER